LYASLNIIILMRSGRMRWAGHVARVGGMRNLYKTLIGKSEVKNPLRRHRSRWENIIRMDLRGRRVRRCGLDASGAG